ncbi:diguanylate cyclase (GGDEF) domain-containing protein [Thermus arciformis]|uniref:Diguanylate cyclase (GGDEF) domain-containing protein n=1 Tax=Thermus arciformis TaxID=482827 RepID=A0A1G7FD82_9DEIN|nr:GGDEF domain-containing protein [Thermus arciformis]SDE73817.1 diguanylate cyclase (GGDEF) domain-containing protein [Thermus arciformis]
MSPSPGLWPTLGRLYWRLAWVPAVWLPVVFLYGGAVMVWSTLLYWTALPLAYAWGKRTGRERLAVALHLGVAVFTALLSLVAPPEAVVRGLPEGAWRLGVMGFYTVGAYALAAFGGWPGLFLGLAYVLLAPWPQAEVRFVFAGGTLLASVGGLSVGILVDRLEALQRLVEGEALTDPLTRLANRRALEREFPRFQALAAREGFSLLSLWDLDNLKEINDQKGHAAGDAHLVAFARALREEARQGDALYRIGGDEFVGLHLGLGDGGSLEARVRARFPGVSVGFAPVQGQDLAEVLQAADQAMYGKKRGRGG